VTQPPGRLPAADPGPDRLHRQRLAALVRPRQANRAVADPGATERARRRQRHPLLQPPKRQPL